MVELAWQRGNLDRHPSKGCSRDQRSCNLKNTMHKIVSHTTSKLCHTIYIITYFGHYLYAGVF